MHMESEYSGIDRRKYPRFNLAVEVQYTKHEASRAACCGESRDISLGGVCLIAYEIINVADTLSLEIKLPKNNNIKSDAIVRWIRPFVVGTERKVRYDIGLEFINLDKQAKDKLTGYLFKLGK